MDGRSIDRREQAGSEQEEAIEQPPKAPLGGEKVGVEQGQAPATVDRDALHESDYGSRREPEGAETDETKQGGVIADEAAGGGRRPTVERDRDYDPDGDRGWRSQATVE